MDGCGDIHQTQQVIGNEIGREGKVDDDDDDDW